MLFQLVVAFELLSYQKGEVYIGQLMKVQYL